MPMSNSFNNGKSSSMYLPPPPPPPFPKTQAPSVVDSNKLPVVDFSSLPPPPPPIAFDVKNSPPPVQQNPYKPGLATEMLESSLRNLQVSEKDEFRTNAGKIISLMLESRLNDKETAGDMTPNNKHFDDSAITMSPNGKAIVQINGGKPKQNGSGTVQMVAPETVLSQTKSNQNGHNGKFSVLVTLPATSPPPPPPPTPQFNSVPPSFERHTRNGNAPVLEHGSPGKKADNNAGDHTNNGGVVFRNKESKLTTHARDRRSYIEKDSNIINNNNNKSIECGNVVNTNNSKAQTVVMATGTTDKASELVDGLQPVCSCCNMKITR